MINLGQAKAAMDKAALSTTKQQNANKTGFLNGRSVEVLKEEAGNAFKYLSDLVGAVGAYMKGLSVEIDVNQYRISKQKDIDAKKEAARQAPIRKKGNDEFIVGIAKSAIERISQTTPSSAKERQENVQKMRAMLKECDDIMPHSTKKKLNLLISAYSPVLQAAPAKVGAADRELQRLQKEKATVDTKLRTAESTRKKLQEVAFARPFEKKPHFTGDFWTTFKRFVPLADAQDEAAAAAARYKRTVEDLRSESRRLETQISRKRRNLASPK